ncbi:unnamed protein product, partial [Didymodactylos carnosus]
DLLIPFRFGCTRLILVGDPQQLSPCVLSDAGKMSNLSQSLHFRLDKIFNSISCESKPSIMLRVQYRMLPEIALFPNEYFYNGKLTNGGTHQRYPLKPLFYFNIETLSHKYDVYKSVYNTTEAKILSQFCRLIILHLSGNNYETWKAIRSDDEIIIKTQQRIGIITPYNGQVREIQKQLKTLNIYHTEIGSVDSFQGKEKDVILISTVRCKNAGFLNIENRLNVMLTRAKYGQYIFGNLTHLKQYNGWKELIDSGTQQTLNIDNTMSFDIVKMFRSLFIS